MVFGYVYCLSNPEMPGIFKVDYVAANVIPRDGEYIYEQWSDVRRRINGLGVWMTEFVKMEYDADIVCAQINCVLLNNHPQMNDNLYAVDVRELVDVFALSGGPWVDHNRIVASCSDMDTSDSFDCSDCSDCSDSSDSSVSSGSEEGSASQDGSDADDEENSDEDYETPEMARLRYRNKWNDDAEADIDLEIEEDGEGEAEAEAEDESESTEERLCNWC